MKRNVKGLLLVLVISVASMMLSSSLKGIVELEALTIAIVIGILLANLIHIGEGYTPGITYAYKKILKVGIVLLGFKLKFQTVVSVGPSILGLIVVYIVLAMVLAVVLAKFFGVGTKLATLIGVGSSICGASAVVAMVPVIKAKESDGLVAVAVVSVLGSIGVLLYTILFSVFSLSPEVYGLWSGLSLHGVAHSVAAAFAGGEVSAELGAIVKMTRVLMLVPMSLILAKIFDKSEKSVVRIPVYLILFVLAVIVNSIGLLPTWFIDIAVSLSSFFILLAMAGMGLSVHFNSLKNKAPAAVLLGSLMFIVLSISSYFVIALIV